MLGIAFAASVVCQWYASKHALQDACRGPLRMPAGLPTEPVVQGIVKTEHSKQGHALQSRQMIGNQRVAKSGGKVAQALGSPHRQLEDVEGCR